MRGKEIINMSEVFNNDFTSESNQQPSNSYPYSFEQPAAAQPQPSAPAPDQKKKGGKAGKIVALLLACALVGGGSGFGAAALMQKNAAAQPQSTTQASSDASVMLEAKRQAAALQVASVDTGKVLTPSEVYAQNVNSTVGITTSITTNYFGYQTTSAAAGSGFILTQDGYILTNYHVVEGSNSIKVTTYDGTSYDAQLIGYDESNDIAVLKIDATDLTPVVLGDSDTLNVGDTVVAIGNPLGDLDYSLNVGYISAKDRDVDLDGPSIRMMQLDAAINPGNSGGPLFDLRGNVVGVTTAKYSGETVTGATIEGIGFAIPINDVREILSELREYGRVPNRAQLGVMVGTVYSTNTARNGRVQVRDVTEDSAGAHAGLRDGDFILALDDYTVRTLSDLSAALRHYRGGQHATLTIERYGKTFRLPIVFDSKDDAVQNEEPTTSANALEPSEQDSPRP